MQGRDESTAGVLKEALCATASTSGVSAPRMDCGVASHIFSLK